MSNISTICKILLREGEIVAIRRAQYRRVPIIIIAILAILPVQGFGEICFNLPFGISKTDAIHALKENNTYLDQSNNYVLAAYWMTDPDNFSYFSDKGNKIAFIMYVFSRTGEKLNRCVLYSILSQKEMANRKSMEMAVTETMKSKPKIRDNESGIESAVWSDGNVIALLWELQGVLFVDYKLMYIDYEKSAMEIYIENASWAGR